MSRSSVLRFLIAALVGIVVGSPAQAEEIQSLWNVESISVDGWANEWQGHDYTYFDDESTAIGVRNDAGSLYLIFLTRDRRYLPSLSRGGVTFWFNHKANKDKQLGFEYKTPLKMKPQNEAMADRMATFEESEFNVDTATTFTMIIEKERSALVLGVPEGPTVAATLDNGTYCCELQVPLSELVSHGINLHDLKDGKFGIGIESGKLERMEGRGDFGREGSFGGMRGGGGMPGGGVGGGPPGGVRREFQRPEQLKRWIKVVPAESGE